MSLGKQITDIPMNAGLDKRTDPKLLGARGFVEAKNVYFGDANTLKKRPPFTAVGTTGLSSHLTRNFFATESVSGLVNVNTAGEVGKYNATRDAWTSGEIISTHEMSEKTISNTLNTKATAIDCAYDSTTGSLLVVFEEKDYLGKYVVSCVGMNLATGQRVYSVKNLFGASYTGRAYPRVVCFTPDGGTAKFYVFAHLGNSGTHADIAYVTIAVALTAVQSAVTTVLSAQAGDETTYKRLLEVVLDPTLGFKLVLVYNYSGALTAPHGSERNIAARAFDGTTWGPEVAHTIPSLRTTASYAFAVCHSSTDTYVVAARDSVGATPGVYIEKGTVSAPGVTITVGSSALVYADSSVALDQLAFSSAGTTLFGLAGTSDHNTGDLYSIAITPATPAVGTKTLIGAGVWSIEHMPVSTPSGSQQVGLGWRPDLRGVATSAVVNEECWFLYDKASFSSANYQSSILGARARLGTHMNHAGDSGGLPRCLPCKVQTVSGTRYYPMLRCHPGLEYAEAIGLVEITPDTTNNGHRAADTGRGVFLPSAVPWWFDGNRFVDAGWLPVDPPTLTEVSPAASGIGAGTYSYVWFPEWTDAMGNIHRGTPSDPISITIAGSKDVTVAVDIRQPTCKGQDIVATGGGPQARAQKKIRARIFRTKASGSIYYELDTEDGGYELTGGLGSGSSRTVTDGSADATIEDNAVLYTAAGELEASYVPPCRSACIHQDRLCVVATDRDEVWYSKPREDGFAPEFHSDLYILAPATGLLMTGVESQDDTIYIWRERSVYATAGIGLNAFGNGAGFQQSSEIVSRYGLQKWRERSIVKTDAGVYFASQYGIRRLARSRAVESVGELIDPVVAPLGTSLVCEGAIEQRKRLVLFTGNATSGCSSIYCFDEAQGKWTEWNNTNLYGALAAGGGETYISSAGTSAVGKIRYDGGSTTIQDFGTTAYAEVIETGWIQLAGAGACQRIYQAVILGKKYLAATAQMTVKLYADWWSTAPISTMTWGPGGVETDFSAVIPMPTQTTDSMKIRIESLGALSWEYDFSVLSLVWSPEGVNVKTRNALSQGVFS